MSLSDKLKFRFWSDVDAVVSLFEKWTPGAFRTEKEYESSLYEFLHKELGDIQVTKQFASGRIRADLVVADKIIIELKHNLNSTGKYQRLIGQIETYKEWSGRTVILLTGKTDPNLRKELDKFLRTKWLDFFQRVSIFQK